MTVLYTNNATTTLNGAITDITTSITVTDASVFPAVSTPDHAYLTIISAFSIEIIKVTDITGNVITCIRGEDGTSAVSFPDQARVDLRVTKALLDDLAFGVQETEEQVATADQTVFTLTGMTYFPGVNNLDVYINGVRQYSDAYAETSTTVITFTSGLDADDKVKFVTNTAITSALQSASSVGYSPDGIGAVDTNVQAKLRESPSLADYDTLANYVASSSDLGHHADASPAGVVTRIRDRLFVGDAARFTGNQVGANGYGTSWTTDYGASWIIKNSIGAFSSEGSLGSRIGVLGSSKTSSTAPNGVCSGVAAMSYNTSGSTTYARGLYVEAMHYTTAANSSMAELQGGNFTTTVPVANAYSMGGSVLNGLYMGVESGEGYTVGDADTPISQALNPAGAGIDISGGTLNAAYQKWTTGIVIRNGALVRDGGLLATAISLAQKHQIRWEVNASGYGANIWSEVTDAALEVGIKFENKQVGFTGISDKYLFKIIEDTVGTSVNYGVFRSSRTAVAPSFAAEGTDTNIGLEFRAKGNSFHRFTSHAGTGESFRINSTSSAPTDYIAVQGSPAGAFTTISNAGVSTNIDFIIAPKGTGVLRFGTYAAAGAETYGGYITIRDSGGTVRKLAIFA